MGYSVSRNTKSGAGEQFLQQDCMAKARGKGVCCSQTPVVLLALSILVSLL